MQQTGRDRDGADYDLDELPLGKTSCSSCGAVKDNDAPECWNCRVVDDEA